MKPFYNIYLLYLINIVKKSSEIIMEQNYLTSIDEVTMTANNGDTYLVRDYTNRLDISPILEKYKDKTLKLKLGEDERLEYISYRLYGTTDYWDSILLLNGITSISYLPVGQDKLESRITKSYNEWLNIFGKTKTQKQKEEKFEELKEIEIKKNEKYRYIKYIADVHITDFEMDLRDFKRNVKKEYGKI